jgi:hypothetical protein
MDGGKAPEPLQRLLHRPLEGRVRLLPEHGSKLRVLHPHRLAPQIAHLLHLAKCRHQGRGERQEPPRKSRTRGSVPVRRATTPGRPGSRSVLAGRPGVTNPCEEPVVPRLRGRRSPRRARSARGRRPRRSVAIAAPARPGWRPCAWSGAGALASVAKVMRHLAADATIGAQDQDRVRVRHGRFDARVKGLRPRS